MFIDHDCPWLHPAWNGKGFLYSTVRTTVPWEDDNRHVISDFCERRGLHIGESHPEINLITDQGHFHLVRESEDFLHVFSWEDSTHRVCRINDIHEGSFFSHQWGCVLEIYLKVLLFFEFVRDSFPLHGRAQLMIEGIPNFWNQHFISLVSESHKGSKESHIDSVIDLNVCRSKRDFCLI